MTSTQGIHLPPDSGIWKANCVKMCRSNCCRVVLQAVHNKNEFQKPDKTISLSKTIISFGFVVTETWSPAVHQVEALEQLTIVEGLCLFLSVQCTQPGRNYHRIESPYFKVHAVVIFGSFIYMQFCGQSKWGPGEITPHIATSIPRHTNSGTKSATSGISET